MRMRRVIAAWIMLAWCVMAVAVAAAPAEIIVTAGSLARAVATAGPGDTLLLDDGLYRDVTWQFKALGQEGKPITLRARHPGMAVLTGKAQLTITGEHLVVSGLIFDQAWGQKVVELSGARHCRLTDCAFIECGNPASTFSHVVYLVNSSQRNRVDHCYMQGSLSMSMGVRIHDDDFANTHNTFDHNYFRDIVRRFSNGQEAVQVGQGKFSSLQVMHTLVEHNLFERASGDGEIISNKSCGNTYRFNTFRDCKGSLTLRSGSSVLVQGNVFLNCSAGVRIHAAHSAIIGNVIQGCEAGLLLNLGNGPEPDADGYVAAHHCLLANNVIRNCKSSAIRIGAQHGHGATLVPFANLFVNNFAVSDRGTLLKFDAPNDSRWRAVSLWPQGKAIPGAQPEGVAVEQVELVEDGEMQKLPAGRAGRVREFADEIKPLLVAQLTPRTFEEVFPENMAVKVLQPEEAGPAWMQGRPGNLPRIANPKPTPPLPAQKPVKK